MPSKLHVKAPRHPHKNTIESVKLAAKKKLKPCEKEPSAKIQSNIERIRIENNPIRNLCVQLNDFTRRLCEHGKSNKS